MSGDRGGQYIQRHFDNLLHGWVQSHTESRHLLRPRIRCQLA
jgi:hypothetical protein